MGRVINKPLASKEADAVNICPGTVTLGRAPGVFILATLSLPLSIFWRRVPLPGRLSPAPGRCSGMCLRRCTFANTAVRREMRFRCYHYLAEEEGHISLRVNARLLRRSSSPRAGMSKHLRDGSMELSSVSCLLPTEAVLCGVMSWRY